MKPRKFPADDRVPWKLILSYFIFLFSLSFTESACCQKDFSENAYATANTLPNFLRLNEVNRNASRHFMDHFLMDGTEKWLKENGYYVASFTETGVLNRAYYKSNGNFKFILKSYDAESLDKVLKKTILQRFPGYYIRTVLEITDLEETVYIIKIVNKEYIKTISCAEGKLEVTENILNGEG